VTRPPSPTGDRPPYFPSFPSFNITALRAGMFFFPYLSLLKRQVHMLRWSSFRTHLLVWAASPPLMALCLFFHRSGSPRWLSMYITPFLLFFRYCAGSQTRLTSRPSTSLPRNLCLAPISTPVGWLTPIQSTRRTKGSTPSPRNTSSQTRESRSWW